jgi:hypothetical protein
MGGTGEPSQPPHPVMSTLLPEDELASFDDVDGFLDDVADLIPPP